MLTKKANASVAAQSRLSQGLSGVLGKTIDRRTFLKRSGAGYAESAHIRNYYRTTKV